MGHRADGAETAKRGRRRKQLLPSHPFCLPDTKGPFYTDPCVTVSPGRGREPPEPGEGQGSDVGSPSVRRSLDGLSSSGVRGRSPKPSPDPGRGPDTLLSVVVWKSGGTPGRA